MQSIWKETINLPHFDSLEGSANTEVLIIGGGITGILCAWFLQENNIDYLLVEGNTIASGITMNTTAKITAQHSLLYQKLLQFPGEKKAQLYLEANQKAVEKYAHLCRDIPCDFEEKTAYVYSLKDCRKLEAEAKALERLGYKASITHTRPLPFPIAGAIGFEKQAQFHPLKFLAALAQGLNIREHTFVTGFKEKTAITPKGNITFKKVIFATHFPIDNKHGLYFLKMYQHRSYVIALENAPEINGMYIDEDSNGLSLRSYKNLLLLGGGSHRTGKTGGNWQELKSAASIYYPSSPIRYTWATQDCMTLDGIPYIGRYSKQLPDCFVATGYNKWGMTSSMVAALLLKDLILENENPYTMVFDPSRSMYAPNVWKNGWEALTNLLTLSPKRCPHLGCALKWNSAEHSWDCPCHGSRFDENGHLLNNPANGDMKM